ncbi:cell wall-binding repeat-containing protein, partial [Bifidobacterium parmae]
DGWDTAATGGAKYSFGSAVTGNITLYAHWTEVPPAPTYYMVSFDARGGSPTPQTQRVESGKAASQPAVPTRSGYTFDGWYTAATGGAKYSFGSAVTGNITLYAHWTEVPPAPTYYMVSFDARGGSPTPQTQRVESGKAASQPAVPTRSGYTFDGWYTAATGGAKYSFGTAVTSNITLYAHWTENETPQPSKGELRRLSGGTRYQTMGAVVKAAFPGTSDYVVVASGDGYADALSASSLAGGLNAPIVLTTGHGGLSPEARTQISRVGAKRALVIGSEVSVSEQAVAEIRSMGLMAYRVSGNNRYETNLAVYRIGAGLGINWSSKMIVASGEGFADALSISSYAYKNVAPIFLATANGGLPDATMTALRSSSFSSSVVIGSNVVVPDVVSNVQLPSLGVSSRRLYGSGRYETSAKVAQWCIQQGMTVDGAVFASGEGYADALSAGPLAGKSNAVLMLVRDSSSPAVSLAGQYAGSVSKAWVVGSSVVVSNATMQDIADVLRVENKH